jgi:diacylglycerol kinase family enzyme
VNPIGGKGHGQEMFHELLKPMLSDAGTPHEMIVTTGPGHAGRIAEAFDLDEIGAIAVVGGDGLFGEVLNGLNIRPDRNIALKIPIGIIPAGSSNCLACSVGLRQPLAAAFSVARGVIKPLDVLKITMNNDNKVILSVCGVSYGFISEVNTHAGKWRWLFGPMRYSVCGFRTFLASPMAYHVDCRYKPPTTDTDPLFDSSECGPDCEACARNWLKKSRAPSHTGTPTHVDQSYLGSDVVDVSCMGEENEEEEDWKESSVVLEAKRRKFKKVDTKTMLLFSITNLSIRQSQNKTVWNSHCHMASGYMDLVMIPVISRMELLKFFRQFNKGGDHHKENKEVFSVIKAKSVEMKISAKDDELPEWERKIQIAIDGEVFPLQPLRIDTIHGLLNLMCT